jgi:hypothetical protein
MLTFSMMAVWKIYSLWTDDTWNTEVTSVRDTVSYDTCMSCIIFFAYASNDI